MTAYPAPQAVASASARALLRDAVLRVQKASLRPHARAGTVLIYGPEGYQSSALLRESLGWLDGWTFVTGTADEPEKRVDWAFIESLNQSLRQLGAYCPTPGNGGAVADDPVAVGAAFADALAEIDGPVCVVIDNLHFVDDKSAAAIRYGTRQHAAQQQLLLMSSDELTGEGAQLIVHLSMSRPEHNVVVRIPALSTADIQEVALELIGRPVSARVARRFEADTGGNPALVAGLIEAFRDELEHTPHPAGIDLERRGQVPLLPGQQRALARASAAARTAVEVVAVLREPTPLPTVRRVAAWLGLTDAYGAFDLDEAIALGLARYVDGIGVPSVAPPSGVAADRIAGQIPATRRREIHAAAADLLTGPAALPHRIFAMRDDDATLVADLMEGARVKVAAGDNEGAMGLALTATRLAEAGKEYERALLFAGTLALRLHEHPRIFGLIGEFAALPRSLRRDVILADLEVVTGKTDEGIARSRAVALHPDDSPDALAMRAHAAATRPLMLEIANRHDRVQASVDEGRTVLALEPDDATTVDPDLRWMVRPLEHELWLTTWELIAAARLRDEERIADRMARLDRMLRTAPDGAAVIDAVVYQARTLAYGGRHADARNRLRRAIRIGASYPDAWMKYAAHTMFAHLLFLTGEWEKSLVTGRIALEHALDDAYQPTLPTALAVSALVSAARADEEAVRRVERLLRTVPRTARGTVAYDPDLADVMRAEFAVATDDPAAQLAATEAAKSAARPGTVWSWLDLHVDALARLGRIADASAAAEDAISGGTPWIRSPLAVSRLRARIALARGDLAAAVELYARHTAGQAAATLPFELARDRVRYAQALQGTGARDAAVGQLELAAATFKRLGARTYLERTQRAIAELRGEPGRHPAPGAAPAAGTGRASTPDPLAELTGREREVALAVASGMTNREVAERLYVSVTTVNFHVRNILAKLGLASRRELRTLVHEHGSGPSRPGRRP